MSIIRKNYTAEFKAKVVRESLREEKSLSQIASAYATHVNVISRWRDQALSALPGIFDERSAQEQATKEGTWEKEREGLDAEIGKLTTQLTWIKKKARLFGRGEDLCHYLFTKWFIIEYNLDLSLTT